MCPDHETVTNGQQEQSAIQQLYAKCREIGGTRAIQKPDEQTVYQRKRRRRNQSNASHRDGGEIARADEKRVGEVSDENEKHRRPPRCIDELKTARQPEFDGVRVHVKSLW